MSTPAITVCVRKRPLNKRELVNGDHDTIEGMSPQSLVVLEPKVKVDMRKYIERWPFTFDLFMDERTTNVDIYRMAVVGLVDTALAGGHATCFAYGQTGSGKTHTMMGSGSERASGVYILAAQDLFSRLGPQHIVQVSLFEIYAGKLYDLLNRRAKVHALADARDNVVITGLSEKTVQDPERLMILIEKGAAERASGITAANADSSRSHAILQLAIRSRDDERLLGKLAFIDLAGSERGADTAHCDRQTRMEGADINKSLLALKECIRALALNSKHIPFRGSKLTSVLKDSFTGRSRAVMIACISPASSNCEHTLNTLRYAYRVKELKSPEGVADRPKAEVAAAAPKPSQPGPCYPGLLAEAVSRPGAPAKPKPKPKPQPRPQWNDHWALEDLAQPSEALLEGRLGEGEGNELKDVCADEDEDLEHLREEHNKIMDSILEEEDAMVDFQRSHIDEKMELVKKELEAMELLDHGKCGVDEYVRDLDAILSQQILLLTTARERLQHFQDHLLEEEILNTTVLQRTLNKRPPGQ